VQNLIIASTSTVHNQDFLEYLLPNVKLLFKDCKEVLFIPYARPSGISHDHYTNKVQRAFKKINLSIKGIHEYNDLKFALQNAQAIYVGGGNTFLLVSELYNHEIMSTLRDIIKKGTPYLGTSAGSNIAGVNMQTTNDMPIVYPPSYTTLGILPFNINPHYLDTNENSHHMGETRETRIHEFLQFNSTPVVGLREGSWIEVKGEKFTLKGSLKARVFKQDETPFEIESETDLSELKSI
jgi:dipeptidase E